MRIGEAIALNTSDFDAKHGVLKVRSGKFGKTRLLPLHPSTVAGLRHYVRTRNQLRPRRVSDALFISLAGTPLSYNRVHRTFKRLTQQAGLAPRSATCRPRIHDLRHSFAVTSLLTPTAGVRTCKPCCPGCPPTSAMPTPSTRFGTSRQRPSYSPWPPSFTGVTTRRA